MSLREEKIADMKLQIEVETRNQVMFDHTVKEREKSLKAQEKKLSRVTEDMEYRNSRLKKLKMS